MQRHLMSDFGKLFVDDPSRVEETIAYCNFKSNACSTYNQITSIQDVIGLYADQLSARSYNDVLAGATLGNPADALEAGLR